MEVIWCDDDFCCICLRASIWARMRKLWPGRGKDDILLLEATIYDIIAGCVLLKVESC